MKRIYSGYFTYINVAITLFCIASLLYNVETLQLIGYVFLIIAILFFTQCALTGSRTKIGHGYLHRLNVLFLTLLFIIEMLRNISFRAIEVLGCFFIALIVFYAFATVDLKTIKKKWPSRFLLFELFLLYIPFIMHTGYSPVDGGYWSFYSTTTFLGFFSCLQVELCVLLYYNTKDKGWLWLLLPLIFLVYLSKVRTAYIGVLIIFLIVLFQRFTLTRKNSFYRLLKWFFLGTIMIFIIIYPQLDQFEWSGDVEALVYLYTGKILLSGRNEIWADGLHYVSQSPYFGYGLDTSFIDISMHNSYLQIILESGAFGMIGVVILINSILGQICKNGGKIYKLIFIFSLVNLLLSTTEVMLFHGQMILEVMVWAIMGIGVNKSLLNSNNCSLSHIQDRHL